VYGFIILTWSGFEIKVYALCVHADTNAALNIAYRALGCISKVGVTVNMPELKLRTFASVDRNAMMTKEATYFNRW
jgi:hypothetical protein